MQEHTVTLQDDEFRLIRKIRNLHGDRTKQQVIENLLRQIELPAFHPRKPVSWLQIGDKTCFHRIHPVKPEQGAPLASDMILAQRNRLAGAMP